MYVTLQSETGTTIEGVTDWDGKVVRALPLDDESFPMLGYIAEYGDTIFNRIQMKRFIPEWRHLMSRISDPAVLSVLAEVEGLAQRCQSEPHLYLRFMGD